MAKDSYRGDLKLRAAAVECLETWNAYIDPADDDTAEGIAFDAHVAALKKLLTALNYQRPPKKLAVKRHALV